MHESLTVVLIELNDLRSFDDSYRHSAAVKVLSIVDSCLRKVFGSNDMSGRYRCDGFVVVLPNTDAHNALQMCSRISPCIEKEPYQHTNRHTAPIGLSFGAAVFPQDANTLEES
jgi:diguanylate cyclase (GGDEF)-like protein